MPLNETEVQRDSRYRELFLTPLRECANYIPQLGGQSEEGISLGDFRRLYGADPLYNWIGLDSPAMYAAHKAAGGITSVYRQLGVGCERLCRHVIQDSLGLTADDVKWGYDVLKDDGTSGRITLDVKFSLTQIQDAARRAVVKQWLSNCAVEIGLPSNKAAALNGAVFEVRQGYKSADSKRQNADLRSALKAYQEDLLPVVMVVSSQINRTVARRYRSTNLLILVGLVEGSSSKSTFVFYKDVVGYDLAAFFTRNQAVMKSEVQAIVASLLAP